MKPLSLQPTEYDKRSKKPSLKRNGMKKCQYNKEGHEFQISRPRHLSEFENPKHMSLMEYYHHKIEECRSRSSSDFFFNKVYFLWKCSHCGKEKSQFVSCDEADKIISNYANT